MLRNGSEKIETVIDYSGSPDEEQRVKRAEMRAARTQASQKKFW